MGTPRRRARDPAAAAGDGGQLGGLRRALRLGGAPARQRRGALRRRAGRRGAPLLRLRWPPCGDRALRRPLAPPRGRRRARRASRRAPRSRAGARCERDGSVELARHRPPARPTRDHPGVPPRPARPVRRRPRDGGGRDRATRRGGNLRRVQRGRERGRRRGPRPTRAGPAALRRRGVHGLARRDRRGAPAACPPPPRQAAARRPAPAHARAAPRRRCGRHLGAGGHAGLPRAQRHAGARRHR